MKMMGKKKEKTLSNTRMPQSRPGLAILFLTLGLLTLVSIIDYHPSQSHWHTTAEPDSPNLVGKIGASLAFCLLSWLGLPGWVVPAILLGLSFSFFRKSERNIDWKKLLGSLGILISLSGLFAIIQHNGLSEATQNQIYKKQFYINGIGGSIGNLIHNLFTDPVGIFGSTIILIGILSGSLYAALADSIFTRDIISKLKDAIISIREKNLISSVFKLIPQAFFSLRKLVPQKADGPPEDVDFEEIKEVRKQKIKNIAKEITPETKPAATLTASPIKKGVMSNIKDSLKIIKSEKTEKTSFQLPQRKGNYIFPTLDILAEAPSNLAQTENYQETVENLVETLSQFGVKVHPGEIHTGPVITRYEVTPAAGVRVEKIANLDKNIALGLKAISVRILAPVPGKGCVGIEVPNKNPLPVCLREIIESKAWNETKAEIPIVLGKDVTGKPMVADLTRMPHLLIAGSTGSGKTVCINSIIASLVYHSSPEDLRFIMVDPKIVEMQVFNSLPHMLIPVVTDPKKVPAALKWLIKEMERRYQIFAKEGVRNIAGFNAKILKNKEEREKAKQIDADLSPEERAAVHQIEVPRDIEIEIPKTKLPYVVCIIDELADLMMVAPADIESGIARLAQLARAAGIHLIVATQRPSVNVITGVIKANLPSRIAFKVASKVDSRTIIDGGGADTLIGRGDMLFIPPGISNLVRAQGAFVSDDEINNIVEFLKRNGPPQYAEMVQKEIDAEDSSDDDSPDWEDELIPDALDVIRNSNRASTSMLQRRLRIGYNRAARIMEMLEAEGYVGADNGSQPREILKELDR